MENERAPDGHRGTVTDAIALATYSVMKRADVDAPEATDWLLAEMKRTCERIVEQEEEGIDEDRWLVVSAMALTGIIPIGEQPTWMGNAVIRANEEDENGGWARPSNRRVRNG